MIRNITSLGEKEARLIINLRTTGKTVFDFADAKRASGETNARNVAQRLYALTKKGWLERLEKGRYLILPFEAGENRVYTAHEFIIAAHLVKPYYIGFRSALNYYGFTEQISKTVYVVTDRQKKSLELDGTVFRFVKFRQEKQFGITNVTIDTEKINISNKEKTIVDCLDRLGYAGGIAEVAKALVMGGQELDLDRLMDYSSRFDSKALAQRLGFLLECTGIAGEEVLAMIRHQTGRSYVKLDPMSPDRGRYMARWHLRVNVSDDAIVEWQASR